MFKRIYNLFKGFLGLFVKGIESKNPEALLEVEKENLRRQISQFNTSLANHAGLMESLISRHKKLQTEETDLKNKIKALIQAGKREMAAELAARFQAVDRQEDEVRAQMEDAKKTYAELTKARDVAVKAARDKIESLSRGLDEMKVNKAMAEMNEMATGMISSIGGSGDTLNRLETLIEEEKNKAAGRARVAKDSVDLSGIQAMEEAQKLDGMAALAAFEAEMGLDSPPASDTTTTTPTMGPISA